LTFVTLSEFDMFFTSTDICHNGTVKTRSNVD